MKWIPGGQVVAIAAASAALVVAAMPAGAQHEHHGAADSTAVLLKPQVVRVDRDAIQLRSGASIIDPRATSAAGGSIAELLRTVPGLEIDADGRVSMRGSTGVLVLVNGRRIMLTGDALAAYLRQAPAASLERVEVGTTASALQDADGVAGVVNLVFRDAARRVGMRSLAGSIGARDHYMGAAAATGRLRDAMNWDVAYSMSSMRPRIDSRTARWSVVPGDLPLQTDQDTRARDQHRLHSVVAGVEVASAANVSVALRGAYSRMNGAYRGSSAFRYTDAAGNAAEGTTGSLLEHAIPSGELGAVASVVLGTVQLASEARAGFVDEEFRGAYEDGTRGYRYMTAVMSARQRERVLRNDVRLQFRGTGLELGHESRFRTTTATHHATHFDATVSEAYGHRLDVHAGYVGARRSTGALRVEAGLRAEAERSRITLDSAGASRALRFFPSIRGAWTDARRALVYRFAYGRRISRPGAEMLNPFSMGGDDMNETVGNPSLVPETSDQLEVGIERHRPRSTVIVTPFIRRTRDPIRQRKIATASGGATTTLVNATSTHAMGADGSVRIRPVDHATVTLAGSIARYETAGEAAGSRGTYATGQLTVDLRLAARTTAHVYAFGRSAQAIEQGEILPAFTSEVALTQRLAGDRARVTLRLDDPWRSDRIEFRVADDTFTQHSRRRTARPVLSLFASYAVGGAPREATPGRTEGPARIF